MKDNNMHYLDPGIEVLDVTVEAGFGVSGDIDPGGSGGELRARPMSEGYDFFYEDDSY